jgi:hypothetical protein
MDALEGFGCPLGRPLHLGPFHVHAPPRDSEGGRIGHDPGIDYLLCIASGRIRRLDGVGSNYWGPTAPMTSTSPDRAVRRRGFEDQIIIGADIG